ncbi:MAG: twitching motility protein [Proteobacteria bacterium]|nr:twitching motility protein [Pseudomonadota bacterium]MBU1058617.1 twitching motility protein [Pseudomonadota bacterium]
MELNENQSALILETDENGEISVEVASGDHKGITGALCKALAIKLMQDVDFQEELMEMLDEDDEEDEKSK